MEIFTSHNTGTAQVINHGLHNVGVAAQGQMPNTDALRKTIRRKRAIVHQAPPNPATLADLVIPNLPLYREYEVQPGQTELFLLAESPQGPDKIVLLGRDSNVDMMARSDRWYIDGTFKIAPLLFYQVSIVTKISIYQKNQIILGDILVS